MDADRSYSPLSIEESGAGEALATPKPEEDSIPLHEVQCLRDISRCLCIWGSCIWGTAPILAYSAYFDSTCSDGAATALYSITALRLCSTLAIERYVMQCLTSTFAVREWKKQEADESEAWQTICKSFQKAVETCSSASSGKLDFWVVLVLLGALQLADLDTDSLQIGQVEACDAEDPRFNIQYARSFHIEVVQWFVTTVRYKGLCVLLLLTCYVNQGIRGAIRSRALWIQFVCNNKVFIDTLPSLFCDIEASSMWCNMLHVNKVIRLTLRNAEVEFQCSANTLQQKAAELDKKALFQAQEYEKTVHHTDNIATGVSYIIACEETIPRLEEAKRRAEKATKRAERANLFAKKMSDDSGAAVKAAVFASIRDVVVLENAPSLILTSGFLALRLHAKKPPMQEASIVKVVVSLCLSGCSALIKARKVAQYGKRGYGFACAIVLMVTYTVVKTGLAFHCKSGFFSFMTWKCDQAVD